jgi:hypothetical protein
MRTPLGVLSVNQLDKGEIVLEQMEEELCKPSPSNARLEALSSEFYTKIPHKLPMSGAAIKAMVIRSKEQLKAKQELLQMMRDMLGVVAHGSASVVSCCCCCCCCVYCIHFVDLFILTDYN